MQVTRPTSSLRDARVVVRDLASSRRGLPDDRENAGPLHHRSGAWLTSSGRELAPTASTTRLNRAIAARYHCRGEGEVAAFLARRPDVERELLEGAPLLARYAGTSGRLILETEVLPGETMAGKLWIRIETQLEPEAAESAWRLLMDEWGDGAYSRTALALIPDVIHR